jgi:hypothetical protein
MAMQPRERVMALGLGLTAGLILLYWGFGQYQSIFSRRETDLTNLKRNVNKQETEVALINKALAQRRELEKRSLPIDPVAAHALYQDWLLDLIIVQGKLDDPIVTYRPEPGNPKGYEPLGFDVKGRGSLDQITKVLYEFYAAGHLHQITSLDIKPQPKEGNLQLNMHVEAIILPGTDRQDSLTTEKGDSLAISSYDAYQKPIAERNLFAEYTPKVSKPEGKPLDAAKFAFVSSIVRGIDDRPSVWIHERTAGKTTQLFVGNDFEVAGVKGKVKSIDIDGGSVELEIDGKTVTVPWGKSLGDTLAQQPS